VLHRTGDSLRENAVVDLTTTRWDSDAAAFEAVRNGETYTTQGHRPFRARPDDPVYTSHDGTYYRLQSVIIGERTATYPVLRLFAVDRPPTETGEAVATTSLPDVDQRAIEIAHMAARARDNEGGVPWGLVRRGGYVYRQATAREASQLVGAGPPSRVRFRGTVYTTEMTDETFHEPVYRATAEPVADSPAQMEAILRARLVDARVTRETLSTAARDILQTAQADGYSEVHPYSEGYRAVLRTLHKRAYLDGDIQKDAGGRAEGDQLLQYDGAYYDHRLRFVAASATTS
jgi:hypothetical protein